MHPSEFDFDRFDRDGYCVVQDVLSPEELAQVRRTVEALACAELEAGVAHLYAGDGRLQRVWNLLNKGAVFRDLVCRDGIVHALDRIFDRPTVHEKYFLSSLQANILRPGAAAQKMHIDTPVPEPLPAWIIKANTIWLLDDFTADNGATQVVPGTHRLDYKPRLEDPAMARLTTVIAPAGSVLFTHGALWHRSGANTSAATRTVLLGSFAASFAREIACEEDIDRMLDADVREQFGETLRRIVGLDHGSKAGAGYRHPEPP